MTKSMFSTAGAGGVMPTNRRRSRARLALIQLVVVLAMLFPLQPALAWKPYMHNGLGKYAMADAVDDGQVTINGRKYAVRPEIVAALRNYPGYYNAGVIGPDGYPDLTFGQSVIHPEETGKWLRHIYNRAWAAQSDPRYTAQQKSQILAFAYGYLTHAAGDLWAHTLVNEYAEGIFPAVKEALTDSERLEVALRHLIIEGYIGSAFPEVDNNPDRTRLPDGDFSDDSTPRVPFNVPVQFVYEALVDPFVSTPVNGCQDNVDDDLDGVLNDGCPTSMWPAYNAKGGHDKYVGPYPPEAPAEERDGEHGSPVDGAETKRGPLLDFFVMLRAQLEVARQKYRDDRDHQDCLLADWDCDKVTTTRTVQTVRGRMSYEFTRNVCDAAVFCAPDPADTIDAAVDVAVVTYFNAWIKDIDDGLKAWPELGHALTQAQFDPQARRDAQNHICRNRGADTADPESLRGKCEDRIGVVDVVMYKASPFITNHLLSMVGAPDFVGGGIEILDGMAESLDDVLGPSLNPLRMAADEIREQIKQKIYEEVNDRFGVDIEAAWPFFRHATNWLGVNEPIVVRIKPRLDEHGIPMWEDYTDPDTGEKRRRPVLDPIELQLFTNRQHERIDALLGLPADHHVPDAPPHDASYIFPNGLPPSTRLADGVWIKPMQVAPARNTIITSKLLLLDGAELNRALGDELVSRGVIKSTATVKTYHNTTGMFPANIMIDGLSESGGATAQRTWLKSIDSDHAWRQDGLPVFCDANPNPATPDPADGICVRSAHNPSRLDGKPSTRLKHHVVDTEWENGSHGNFPLWESCLLRPAFRGIFTDWENGVLFPTPDARENFPDHWDDTVPDVGTFALPMSLLKPQGATYNVGTNRFVGLNHTFGLEASDPNNLFATRAMTLEYRIFKAGTTPPATWQVAHGATSFKLPADASEGQWQIAHRVSTPCHTTKPDDKLLSTPVLTETFIFDKTPPASAEATRPVPNAAGWTRSDTGVFLTADDGKGAGVKEIRFSATGAHPIPATTVVGAKASLTITREGTTTVSYLAVDNLLQATQAKTFNVKVDKTGATIEQVSPAAGTTVKGNVAMSAGATDNIGVGSVTFLVNDRPVARDSSAPFDASWNSATTFDGRKVVNSCVTDLAGNPTAAAMRTITVDNIPGEQAQPVHTNLVSAQYHPDKIWAQGTEPSMSQTGRYVAFTGAGGDSFLPDDTNNKGDIYVRDRDADNDGIFDEAGATKYVRVSLTSTGGQSNDNSWKPSISGDGRFVAFESWATNLVPNDTNGVTDIFLHDRDTDRDRVFDEPGATSLKRISVSNTGQQGTGANRGSYNPYVSGNGRYVVFQSDADGLVPEDNGFSDIYAYDTQQGKLARMTVTADGKGPGGSSWYPSISGDGRFVAFLSGGLSLVDGVRLSAASFLVHDRDTDRDGIFDEIGAMKNTIMNMTPYGEPSWGHHLNGPVLSADGRFIAFQSQATDLVPYDTNRSDDIFVRDRDTDGDGIFDEPGAAKTELVSVSSCGVQANRHSGNTHELAISADGRYVVFTSSATNLVAEDTASDVDVFVRDRADRVTTRASLFSTGLPATWRSYHVTISGNGAFVGYTSESQLTPDDLVRSSENDVFATKREVIAPNTGIIAGPSGTTTATSATFTFNASETGVSFTCRLDTAAWEPCVPGKTYAGLAKGTHTFQVRATDLSSNTDPTPAIRTWTVQ